MRTAIVGLGQMGLRHLQVLRNLDLPIVGASDVLPAARDKASAQFALPAKTMFADPTAMIEEMRPDLFIVATTAPSHEVLVCRAADAGAKAILCEKPMAVSLAACDRMIEACISSGTRLAVNHQMRFMDHYVLSKSIIDDESFGALGSVTIVAGNFGLAMNGSHYFEMFRYITGESPVEVSAWFSPVTVPNPRGSQFIDQAGSVRLTTAKGRRFYLEAGHDQGHGLHVTFAGSNGRLDIDELAGKGRLVTRRAEHRELPTTRYGMPSVERELTLPPAETVASTRKMVSALIAGDDFPDGNIGRMAVHVLAAAYASHEGGGRSIKLTQDALPRDRVFPWA
jgi:predicted dehydrogenase